MSNVSPIRKHEGWTHTQGQGSRRRGGGSGDGGGPDMTEARLAKLETAMEHVAKDGDLRELKAEVHASLPHLATKADITKAINKIYAAIAVGVVVMLVREPVISFLSKFQ